MEFVKQFGADEKIVFFEKANVNGDDARPVYKYLKPELPNKEGSRDISWNFEIFLVDQEGTPVKRYAPSKTPYDNMKDTIESLLDDIDEKKSDEKAETKEDTASS